MQARIKKICLWAIYSGFGLTLLTTLLMDSRFFYPFISTRVFLFRATVEVLLLLYLVLNVVSDEYRPRLTWLSLFFAAFVVAATASSALGPNPSGSFWGDIERGEGLILWLHLFVYFMILTGVVRRREAWAALLDWSVFVALLMSFVGLSQALRLGIFLTPSGSRVDATLGNPAFLATYLLFHIAFALYLFSFRRAVVAKIYYAACAVLFAVLTVATQTRGAVLGLVLGIILAAALYAFSYRENRKVRLASAAVIAGLLVLGAGLYLARETPPIARIHGLHRVLTISLRARTAQTRLATWRTAYQGMLEKPVLGWGLENFNIVFNKRFPPIIYQSQGSQVWFDRAHNVVLDRGVTTGLLGLLLFLALFAYPFYYFVRFLLRDPETKAAAIIFASFLLAYFVQDLFIFESIAVDIVLFFTLAFFAAQFLPELPWGLPWFGKRWVRITALTLFAAVLGPVLWTAVIYPAKVNMLASAAGKSNPTEEVFFVIVGRHRKFLDGRWTYGLPEYRLQFIDFIGQQLAPVGQVVPRVVPVLSYTDEQVERQIKEQPYDAKNWLLATRHYNYTQGSLPDNTKPVSLQERKTRLQKAIFYSEGAIRLSPTRPPVLQEAGLSELYIYRTAIAMNDSELARSSLGKAGEYFQKTVDLNPSVYDSYLNLVTMHLNAKQTEEVTGVLAAMDKQGVDWRSLNHVQDLYTLSLNNKNYYWVSFFAQELAKQEPDDPQHLMDWALAEAYQGHRSKAIEVAVTVRKFDGYNALVDKFIADVSSGFYEKPENQK